MQNDETLRLGGYRPPVAVMRASVDAFQTALDDGSRRYVADMQTQLLADPEDEFGTFGWARDVDLDTHRAEAAHAHLVIEVANRTRRMDGLEQCFTALQTEDWTAATFVLASSEPTLEERWNLSQKSLTFEFGLREGSVVIDFPSTEARARVLAPVSEAANAYWRKHPKSRAAQVLEKPRRFSFNDDVLKHPLVVSGSSGVVGVLIGAILGWLARGSS